MENNENPTKYEQKKYYTLDINSNFLKLINIFDQSVDNSIFLKDSKNHLTGFVSVEHIFKNNKNEIALKKIQTKLPYFREFDLNKLIKCYLDKNLLQIPIVDQKESISMVYDIFKIAQDYLIDFDFESAKILESIPFTVKKNEKIDHLISEIKKSYIENIIVEEKGEIAGFIEIKKLLSLFNRSEGVSRGEKKGERLKFEGTVDDLINENTDIVINYKEKYIASNLVEIMEKFRSPILYVKDDNNTLLGLISLKRLLILALNSQSHENEALNVTILSAPDENIEQISRKKIISLIERHAPFYNAGEDSEGTVKFHKIENQSQKGMYKYETDIRISFGKGKDSVFTVKSDEWGAEKSLNKAYNKISRLISDKRKISRDLFQKKEIIED